MRFSIMLETVQGRRWFEEAEAANPLEAGFSLALECLDKGFILAPQDIAAIKIETVKEA